MSRLGERQLRGAQEGFRFLPGLYFSAHLTPLLHPPSHAPGPEPPWPAAACPGAHRCWQEEGRGEGMSDQSSRVGPQGAEWTEEQEAQGRVTGPYLCTPRARSAAPPLTCI